MNDCRKAAYAKIQILTHGAFDALSKVQSTLITYVKQTNKPLFDAALVALHSPKSKFRQLCCGIEPYIFL